MCVLSTDKAFKKLVRSAGLWRLTGHSPAYRRVIGYRFMVAKKGLSIEKKEGLLRNAGFSVAQEMLWQHPDYGVHRWSMEHALLLMVNSDYLWSQLPAFAGKRTSRSRIKASGHAMSTQKKEDLLRQAGFQLYQPRMWYPPID